MEETKYPVLKENQKIFGKFFWSKESRLLSNVYRGVSMVTLLEF